jgi:hypothetical protein
MRAAVIILWTALALSTSANGQTSSRIAARSPAQTYSYFANTLRSVRASDSIRSRAEFEVRHRRAPEELPLTDCGGASWYIGYEGDDNSSLNKTADLAFDVLYMRATLEAAGYPKNIWTDALAEYERSNLANIRSYSMDHPSPAKKRLAQKLNGYKGPLRIKRIKVIAEAEGCGAGEVAIKIRTTPSARRVQYINSIKYQLCGRQGIDPQGSRCDAWADYPGGEDGALMSGKNKVRAEWSDGTSVIRDMNVDDLRRNQTFNVRKP